MLLLVLCLMAIGGAQGKNKCVRNGQDCVSGKKAVALSGGRSDARRMSNTVAFLYLTITCAVGGWLSHSTFTGLIMGLTKATSLSATSETDSTLKATNLLERFDVRNPK